MRFPLLLIAALLFSLAPAAGYAADTPAATPATASTPAVTPKPLSDAERAAIEQVIQEYLTKKHPEVVMDAVQELQRRETAITQAQTKEAVTTNHDKIYNDPNSPVGGNPKGDVTVVEFFDYQCPYCKGMTASIEKLLKEDKQVKFIYKDFPILGEASVTAAKAALASVKQDKYIAFNEALMKAPFSHGRAPADDEVLVFKTAKDVGLDVDKLKKDMQSDENAKIVQANLDLAAALGVRGTPMFVINDQIFPGAMEYDQLKKAVDDARAAKAKK
jgi:protein-disulfide isomerase